MKKKKISIIGLGFVGLPLACILSNTSNKNLQIVGIDKKLENKKIGFISYGSGSKAKIFEGNIEKDWIKKTKLIKLFENLDSRKKVSIDVYENLHKRKISSNINNNDGIIKLSKISNGEFTEGLRKYVKY